MRLSDLQFVRLLPHWMQEDKADIGLANGMDAITKPVIDRIPLLSTWDQIDNLPEWELDEIAWEWNLFWYSTNAPIETKRQLIKTGLQVWSKLGTKWACEQVITAYFGEGYIREWFDYMGEPGRFRVYSTNPAITDEMLGPFLDVLGKVKRGSAHLDGIYITLTGEMFLHAGVGVQEVTYEHHDLGANLGNHLSEEMHLAAGFGVYESITETHAIGAKL